MTTTTPPRQPSPRFDAEAGVIHAMVEIAAPPERVYAALTDPRQLGAWWGTPETYSTHDWRMDLRPGGEMSVRTTSHRGNPPMRVRGEFITVDPPRVLEYTWRAEWDGFQTTVVRVELTPASVNGVAGTRLTMTHAGLAGRAEAARNFTSGWTQVLGWLLTYAERAG